MCTVIGYILVIQARPLEELYIGPFLHIIEDISLSLLSSISSSAATARDIELKEDQLNSFIVTGLAGHVALSLEDNVLIR